MKKFSDVAKPVFSGIGGEYLKLSKAYSFAVGSAVAQRSRPFKLEKQVLLVGVNDNIWLSELSMMKDEIISRMQEAGADVKDIRFFYKNFKTLGTKGEKAGRTPTEKELGYADRLAESVPEGELRESIRQAVRSYFTMYSKDDFLKC